MWLLIVLLLTTPLYAATRYVDQNCGDVATYVPSTRACTGGSAVTRNTLAEGVALTQAGDTLFVRAGTYNEGHATIVPNSGTASNKITIARYQNEVVTIIGSPFDLNGSTTVRHVVFDGLVFDGQNAGADNDGLTISNGSGNLRFLNFEVKNFTGSGVVVGESSIGGNEFLKCHVHHNGTNSFKHQFYIFGGGNLVDGCTVHDSQSSGIKLGQAESPISGNVARNNTIYNFSLTTDGSGGAGITSAANNNDSEIYNNVIYNCRDTVNVNPSSGIYYYKGSNNKVYNNTINITGTTCEAFYLGAEISNPIVKNNIFVGGSPVIDDQYAGSKAQVTNNICTSAGTGCSFTASNMGFAGAAGGNFRLSAGSPAIDKGVDLSATLTTDADQNPRVMPWELGAFEVAASGPVNPDPVLERAHWKFDEGSGLVAANSSPFGTPATFNLTLTESDWSVPGIVGPAAFAPDGVSEARLLDARGLDDTSSVSASLWLKMNTIPAEGCTPLTRHDNWGIYVYPDATPAAYIGFGQGYTETRAALPLGTVNRHLGLTYDMNDGQGIRLYVDGSLVASQPYSQAIDFSNGNSLTVGQGPPIVRRSLPCNGVVDDVYIYQGRVTDAGMANLFAAGSSVPIKGLYAPHTRFYAGHSAEGSTPLAPVNTGLTISRSSTVRQRWAIRNGGDE